MTLVLETDSCVIDANYYIDRAFVTTYLTDRVRQTAWAALTTAQQDAYVVAGTDYVEKRWSQRLKGIRQYSFTDVAAIASITFAGVPLATETLTINDFVYTWVAALATTEPQGNNFEVLIGVDAAANASNLMDALTGVLANAGVTYQDGAIGNRHLLAVLTSTTLIDLTSAAPGISGNFNTLLGTITGVTLVAWASGIDGGSQPLSFPQLSLFDRAGIRVEGIPLKLKQCVAEYADRVRVATLDPDPVFDTRGGRITRLMEKVGPIEVETSYSDGSHGTVLIRPYPGGDRLMDEYVVPAGTLARN